jgi:predicted nucleic acid-binding protein
VGKDEIVLVDTSSWVEALRSTGNAAVRGRVFQLMTEARAAVCDTVLVELWNGARGDYEKRKLSELEKNLTCLETTREVWSTARELARKCRKAGETVPTADLIIAACAVAHRAALEHCDAHIDAILKVHASGKKEERA